MTSAEALAYLRDRDAALERFRAAVEAEALPVMLAALAASPGALPAYALWGLTRVGLVERRTDERGTFDMIWLETAAWCVEGPLMLEHRHKVVEGNGWMFHVDRDEMYSEPDTDAKGLVWLREKGRWLPNKGYYSPWIHCGINQRLDRSEIGTIEREPEGDVEAIVFPAARAWVAANGVRQC